MPRTQYTDEEIARRGEEIYISRLREALEKEHTGQVAIINVETGEYEVGTDSLAANKRALAKNPDATLYGIRVGFAFVEKFGGSSLRFY